jgi:hypothetical protein
MLRQSVIHSFRHQPYTPIFFVEDETTTTMARDIFVFLDPQPIFCIPCSCLTCVGYMERAILPNFDSLTIEEVFIFKIWKENKRTLE